ncbi:AEC family transporter [Heliorestis convoluta]|uniref:Auxin efflux carrier family protein n=1 Tax=Heliorestis convoluta TaxID=356322 RepID=A0A5Q2MZU3_9FIRM|nr:AEC family transporter [Heliorestis convoluta]QGG46462.1 auxin efflux carrier family protein [Heliorestis convoluta]
MTNPIEIILQQIMVFALLMTIGFIAAKAKVLTKEGLGHLAKLVVNIILPALIFTIITGSGMTPQDLLVGYQFALAVLFSFALLLLVGYLLSKLLKLEGKTANLFIALSAFGNMGFIGIPLIHGLYTEPIAQVSIAIYTVIDMALLWTVGVYLCSRHQGEANFFRSARNMLNPLTVTLVIAFIIMILQIPLPELLARTVGEIGNTSKTLTLIYIGGLLAYTSMGNLFKKPSLFVLAGVKMVLMPLLIFMLTGFFLPEIPRFILTLIVGLPTMTTLVMIASTYESDKDYAAEAIFLTTLLSLITIPAVAVLTTWIGL